MGENERQKDFRTTVLTAATGYYHVFVLPYAASYHYFNPDSRFEFFVDEPEEFEMQYKEGLEILRERLGRENLVISSPNTDHLHPNHHQAVPRFFQIPTVETEFIYIGDVDVLVLDSMITQQHVLNMERNELPFSNVLRTENPNEKRPRLTGLHFSRYEAYYPLPLEKINLEDQVELDEYALYELVRAKVGDFRIEHRFRPPHGFHFSDKLDYWDRGSSRQVGLHLHYLQNYQLLRETVYWKEIRDCFSPIFLTWLDCLDRTIEVLWPDSLGLPIIKPWFLDGKWIGPGINREVDIIQGVRKVRHQFLQTKSQKESHLGEGSEAGQIFNFIDWCGENDIRSIISISELTPLFLTTISRCFEKIKMLVVSPERFDYDIFQYDHGTAISELIQISKSSQIEDEISKGDVDLAILQPINKESIGVVECLDRIRNGRSERIRYFGIINANLSSEEWVSSDLGDLYNFNLRHDVKPKAVFCLNNRILSMVTGFSKDVVSKEVRVYLNVYDIEELGGLNPDRDEMPTLTDLIEIFKNEEYNNFIQIYESFPNRLENIIGLVHMAIRSYYLTDRYEKCIRLCDYCDREDPLALLFKARSQRNSTLRVEAIATYVKQLEIQPYNTNSLIECVMIMLSLDLRKEIKELISDHIEQTRDRAVVDELVSKYELS